MADFGATAALQEFLATTLGIPVIWLRQNAPRPAKPYAGIYIVSDVGQSFASIGQIDNEGNALIVSHDTVTTTVTIYSPITADPRDGLDRIQALRMALKKPSNIMSLSEGGWAFIDIVLGPNNVPELIGDNWEPRALMDIQWRVARSVIDNLGYVSQINIVGSIDGAVVMDEQLTGEIAFGFGPAVGVAGFDEGIFN